MCQRRQSRDVADLNSTYVFTAAGFGTPPGGSAPTAPKAIVEILSFNGDGTIDTPKVTLSVNGMIINEGPGSSGTYTVDTSTANGICTGTLKFNGGAPKLRYLLWSLRQLAFLADPDGQGQCQSSRGRRLEQQIDLADIATDSWLEVWVNERG